MAGEPGELYELHLDVPQIEALASPVLIHALDGYVGPGSGVRRAAAQASGAAPGPVGRALAAGAMEEECRSIAGDRCDCIHGCFVGNSLKHSPLAVARREVPAVVRLLARR